MKAVLIESMENIRHLSETDEYNLTHHGFLDLEIAVKDDEGDDFMQQVKNGDDLEMMRRKKSYKTKITKLTRFNAHKITFTLVWLDHKKL
jgi:hypothetical protein